MRKPKFNFPVKLVILIIVVFLGALFSVGFSLKSLRTSDYFKIKDIVFNEEKTNLSYLKGENIFSVDLEKESQYITQHYPNFSKVRLVRILPDRIFIDFIKRKPAAIIKLYRNFSVDREAVIFDAPEGQEDQGLPVILGLETKIFGPKIGSRYNIKELSVALNIIKEIRFNRVLRNYKIKKINVANLSNTSFSLLVPLPLGGSPRGAPPTEIKELEIRLDTDNIKDRVSILAGLLNQIKNDLGNIKYIDLRFKEPVIKFDNAK